MVVRAGIRDNSGSAMSKVLVILGKEWLELRKERSLVLTSLLLPLFLTILPLGIAYGAGLAPDDDITQIGAAVADPAFAGMTAGELSQAVLGKQFGILFLLMPLFIPSIIASYSIVGEKTRRTLEPLL